MEQKGTYKELLTLSSVSKFYKSAETVSVGMKDVDLTFNFGEFVAVTGASGSGKSTLLNVISGLDGYEEGEMFLFGEETSHYKIEDWEKYRAAHVGFIFQNYNIIDAFTVYQNVMLALEIQNYPIKERKKRALELIDKVGLTSHKNHKASKLSGGQKQRTVIARALAKDAPIIVADEPTGNLDSKTGEEVMALLHEISKDKLVIVVTHDYSQVENYATRKIKMSDGHVIEDKHIKDAHIIHKDALNPPKQMGFRSILSFANKNLLSQPKRFIFILLLQIIIVSVLTIVYVGQVKGIREEGLGAASFFKAVPSTRMLVQRRDDTPLSQADVDYLESLRDVKKAYLKGENFKNNQTLYLRASSNVYGYAEEIKYFDTIDALSNFQITGNKATQFGEVVISNDFGYNIGDELYLSSSQDFYFLYDEKGQVLQTNALDNAETFTVSGLTSGVEKTVYFSEDYLLNTQTSVIIDERMKENALNQIEEYEFGIVNYQNEEEKYLTYHIVGPNSNIGKDASIKIGKVGSIPGASQQEMEIEFRVWLDRTYIVHNVSGIFDVLDLSNDPNSYYTVAVLEETYFSEIKNILLEQAEPFYTTYPEKVISLSISGYPAGNRLLELINSDEYRIFYPANITTTLRPIMQFLKTILAVLILTVLGGFLYTVLHAVSKNVMSARKKDFAIYRSIGANQKTLGRLVILEQVMISMISLAVVLIIFNVGSTVNLYLRGIAQYLLLRDYFMLIAIFMVFGMLVGIRFNKKVFNHTVIETLSLAREDI